METTGRKWVFGIGLYLIIKGALNLILGFSMSNLVMLIVSVVALVLHPAGDRDRSLCACR